MGADLPRLSPIQAARQQIEEQIAKADARTASPKGRPAVDRVASCVVRNVYDPDTGATIDLEFDSTVPFDAEHRRIALRKAQAAAGTPWALLDPEDAARFAAMARIAVQVTPEQTADRVLQFCQNPVVRRAVEVVLVQHENRFFRIALGVAGEDPILPTLDGLAPVPGGADGG